MTLYNPGGPPLFSTNPIDQLYDDLKKMSSRENFSANLNKYALTLQLTYMNTYSGLDTLISNSSGDPSLDVFVSANNIGKSLGNINLSKEYISQILSRCVSPPDNCFELNKIFVFQSLINDLLKRRNYLQSLGSVSSIGVLPSHGGSLSSNGAGYQSGPNPRSLRLDKSNPFSGSDNIGHLMSNSWDHQGVVPVASSSHLASAGHLGAVVLNPHDLRSANSDVVPSSGRFDVGAVSESTQSLKNDQSLPVDSSSPAENQVSSVSPLKLVVYPRRDNREPVGPDKKTKPIELSIQILEPYFGTTLENAAKKIGISTTTLKSFCRKLGIQRWPYRQDYTTRLSRIQSRGAASSSSSINNRAASSSSGASLRGTILSSSIQEEAAIALSSSSGEAGAVFQAESSPSGTLSPTQEGAAVASSSLSGEAALSSSGASSPGNSNVLEVDSDVDLDFDPMDTLGERDSGDELPPIPQEDTSRQTYTRLGPGHLPPGKTRIGPRC